MARPHGANSEAIRVARRDRWPLLNISHSVTGGTTLVSVHIAPIRTGPVQYQLLRAYQLTSQPRPPKYSQYFHQSILIITPGKLITHDLRPDASSKANQMLDQISYTNYLSGDFPYLDLKKRILRIMGQFLDYLTSVFTGGSGVASEKSNHHVTFAESSFSQSFSFANSSGSDKTVALRRANKRTIFLYQLIIIISFLIHFSTLWPRLQDDSFDILQPQGWQLVMLNLLPFLVGLTAIYAMNEFSKPLPDGTKIGAKNDGLFLDGNDFGFSLKIVVCLMAFCQLVGVYSDLILWSVVILLPIWCFKLSSKLAQFEHERCAPAPKKSWVKLNAVKSPKAVTPKKTSSQQDSSKVDDHIKATPRTRTKKAVKSFLNNVTDKYHAFEQNVAHQISTRMNSPLGQAKMIDS